MRSRVLRLGGVLECLEDLADVEADLLTPGFHTARELQMIGAVREPHAGGNGELAKLPLHFLCIVFGSDLGVERLLMLARLSAGDDLLTDGFDVLIERFVGIRAQPGVGEPILERVRAAEVAENDVELTDDELEELDLLIEEPQDVRFDRAACREVDDVRLASLTDTMDAADALLDDHRIPRKLVIHEAIAELQVQSLGSGARRDEHRSSIRSEGGELLRPFRHGQRAGIDDWRAVMLPDLFRDELQRREMFAEDDQAIRITSEDTVEL